MKWVKSILTQVILLLVVVVSIFAKQFHKDNTGYMNSGNYNSGDYNSGNYNSGYYNLGSHNTGVFNTTDNPTILMFDKPTEWTLEDFRYTKAYDILSFCPFGTYTKEDKQEWWDNLDEKDKDIVKSLPNFDEEKFIRCMDIYHI